VVFDYGDPPDTLPEELCAGYARRAEHVQSLGEAWITHFEPQQLHAGLRQIGFLTIDDYGPRRIAAGFFPSRLSSAPERGGHVLIAASPAKAWQPVV